MKKWMLSVGLTAGLISLSACNNAGGADSEAIVESKAGDITKEEFYKKKIQSDSRPHN